VLHAAPADQSRAGDELASRPPRSRGRAKGSTRPGAYSSCARSTTTGGQSGGAVVACAAVPSIALRVMRAAAARRPRARSAGGGVACPNTTGSVEPARPVSDTLCFDQPAV